MRDPGNEVVRIKYLFETMLSLFLVNKNKLNLSDSLQNRRILLRILGEEGIATLSPL